MLILVMKLNLEVTYCRAEYNLYVEHFLEFTLGSFVALFPIVDFFRNVPTFLVLTSG